MKYTSIIIFSLISLVSNSQLISYVIHGDTVFYFNPLTRDSFPINKPVLKTVNGSSIWGAGNISTTQDLSGYVPSVRTVNGQALSSDITILGNVTNESKATMFTNPAFTGTPTGITATHVGLGNVTNTSDANKPVSTAQQAALDLKQDISTNNGGWITLRVSGSNATTTGQALTDITGLVSGTLLNSTRYEVEVLLLVSTSAVTTGTQYGIQTGGTGGAGVVNALMQGTTTVNAVTQVTLSAPNAAQGTFLTTSGTSGIIKMSGFVTTRGSGTANISIQHLKVTSGTSTVFIGSVLRYRLAN